MGAGQSAPTLHTTLILKRAKDIVRHAKSKSAIYRARVAVKWQELEPLLENTDYQYPDVFWAFLAAHPKTPHVQNVLEIVFKCTAIVQEYGLSAIPVIIRYLKQHLSPQHQAHQAHNPKPIKGGVTLIQAIQAALHLMGFVLKHVGKTTGAGGVIFVNQVIGGIMAYEKVVVFAGLHSVGSDNVRFIIHGLGFFIGFAIIAKMAGVSPGAIRPNPPGYIIEEDIRAYDAYIPKRDVLDTSDTLSETTTTEKAPVIIDRQPSLGTK